MASAVNEALSSVQNPARFCPVVEEEIFDTKEMKEAREIAKSCRRHSHAADGVMNFDQIQGVEHEKEVLKRATQWYKPKFASIKEQVEMLSFQNFLLYGPQGTGKTQLVYSFARWSGFSLFDVDFSAILDQRVGVIEKFLVALFDEAKKCGPAIIFIDEIDGLLCSAKNTEQGYERKLLNSFKTQLGKKDFMKSQTMVIGATSYPWRIADTPGLDQRFAKKLHVKVPNMKTIRQLVPMTLDRFKLAHMFNETEMVEVADAADSLTGADIVSAIQDLSMSMIETATSATHFRPTVIGGAEKYVPCKHDDISAAALETLSEKHLRRVHCGRVNKRDLMHRLRRQTRTVTGGMRRVFQDFESGQLNRNDLQALNLL